MNISLTFIVFYLISQIGFGQVALCEFYTKSIRPRFGIDFDRGIFVKDGEPYRYISGEMHYFRIHPVLWNDRLRRVRHMGLNAIQVYVPWNYHEIVPGQIDFQSESRDLRRFLTLAKQNDLDVLLRIGPYICAEFENGGLPWWLLKTSNISLRTADSRFLKAVKSFFDVLLPLLNDQLYVGDQHGPIIMIQLENEYGSYKVCDKKYMAWLRDLVRKHLGEEITLYTTDGPSQRLLSCGTIDGAFATVDFGIEAHGGSANNFELQRHVSGGGPRVNSEFYVTWFSSWGDRQLPAAETKAALATANEMYALNASFNMYMVHGGTNFGFWSGSEMTGPILTSYDYVAPITEAGDITPAYIAWRNWIAQLPQWSHHPLEVPQNISGIRIEAVETVRTVDLLEVVEQLVTDRECLSTEAPAPFESLPHFYTYVLYSTMLTKRVLEDNGDAATAAATTTYVLKASAINNIGYVYLDDEFQGIVSSLCGIKDHLKWCKPTLTLNLTHNNITGTPSLIGKTLKILVESVGRISYETIRDSKGLGPIKLNHKNVKYWLQCGVDFDLLTPKMLYSLENGEASKNSNESLPKVYFGDFDAGGSFDWRTVNTYFDARPFVKGFTLVNGFNLGRYWTALGPQFTLYAPGPIFHKGKNTVIVVELLGQSAYYKLWREFVDKNSTELNNNELQRACDSHRNRKKCNPTRIENVEAEPVDSGLENWNIKTPAIRFVDKPIYAI